MLENSENTLPSRDEFGIITVEKKTTNSDKGVGENRSKWLYSLNSYGSEIAERWD